MTQQRDEKLNEIMPGWGDKLRAILGLEKGKLDKAGIEHKALGPQITKQDFADAVELAVKMIAIKADEGDDVDIKAEVQAAVDELMTVPQVDLETAGDILQVDDKPEADTAEPDAEPVEDAAAHEHEHEAVEPDELEKALTKNLAFNEQLITDQKALVEVLTEIAGEFKALKELTGLTPKVEALETAIKAMQGEFKQRPRASRANETLADPDAVREMTKDTETTMLWGHIPTKSE